MADVDFSNAVLDINSTTASKQISLSNYLGLGDTGFPNLYNVSGQIISSNANKSFIVNTPSKVSILFSGSFGVGGTEFYIVHNGYSYRDWKVSNITFSAGDSYSFIIDIETEGNT